MGQKRPFSHFLGHFSPFFPVGPKSIFRPFFPFQAGGPKWGLYKAIGIATPGAFPDSNAIQPPLHWMHFSLLLNLPLGCAPVTSREAPRTLMATNLEQSSGRHGTGGASTCWAHQNRRRLRRADTQTPTRHSVFSTSTPTRKRFPHSNVY